MTARPGARAGHFVLCLFVMFLMVLPLHAQDAAATEPALPTEETTLPTEIPVATDIPADTPTDVPVATDAPVEPTVEVTAPTEEVTAVPTDEATAAPTDEVTAVPTDEATSAPTDEPTEAPTDVPAPLPLAYSANFDAGYPAELTADTGWLTVTVDNGQALQYVDGAQNGLYNGATFADGSVEASVLLNSGDVSLVARKSDAGQYSAVLSADGTVSLLKNGDFVNAGTTILTPGAWVTLKLSISGGDISALVDNVPVVSATDFAPLPAGQSGFGAVPGALVRLDNLAIYGAAAGVPVIAAPVVVTEPAEIATEEPTAEATAEATLPPISSMVFDAPTNLQITGSTETTITLTWVDNSDEEASYNVWRKTNGEDFQMIAAALPANTVTFTDNTAACGTVYKYYVTARDGSGGFTTPSNIVAKAMNTCQCNTDALMQIASVNTAGFQGDPLSSTIDLLQISGNGRYIVYTTSRDGLFPDDTSGTNGSRVYRFDRETCTNIQVSVYTAGEFINGSEGAVSADGNRIVFSTSAGILLRDVSAATTTTVSVNTAGDLADGGSFGPVISADGRYVAFLSNSTNLDGDNLNGINVLYVRDTQANTTKRASFTVAGGEITNSVAGGVAISSDGVYIAYVLNLSPNPRAFVYDTAADTTTEIDANVSTDTNVSISDGGMVVVNVGSDVFAYDVSTPTVGEQISLDVFGDDLTGLARAGNHAISPDGRFIVFAGDADYASTGTTAAQAYVYDSQQSYAKVGLASRGSSGFDNASVISNVSISDNGAYTAFVSNGTAALSLSAGTVSAIVARTPFIPFDPPTSAGAGTGTNAITLSWTDNSLDETGFYVYRQIENDEWVTIGDAASAAGTGATVTFTESNLTCGSTFNYRVQAHYRMYFATTNANVTGTTAPCTSLPPCPTLTGSAPIRVSGGYGTIPPFNASVQDFGDRLITPDGRYVVYSTAATDVVPGSPDDFRRIVYRYDTQTCTAAAVAEAGGVPVASEDAYISDDGNFIAFQTDVAIDAGDTNGKVDVYIRNMSAGTYQRASLTQDLTEANDDAYTEGFSSDGHYALIGTAATNMLTAALSIDHQSTCYNNSTSDYDGPCYDLYLYNTVNETLNPVSVNPTLESMGDGDSMLGSMVEVSGHLYITFTSEAGNLVVGDTVECGGPGMQCPDIFLRDITIANNTGTTYLVSRGPTGNGDWVSSGSDIASNGTNLYISFTSYASNLVTGLSTFLPNVFMRTIPISNLSTGTNVLISRATGAAGAVGNGPAGYISAVSSDGRYVAFDSQATNLVGGDSNNRSDVFVRNTVTNTTTRVSVNGVTQGNGDSFLGSMNASGLHVVFVSDASNLVAGGDNNKVCDTDYDGDPTDNCPDMFKVSVPGTAVGTPGALTATVNLPTSINLSWPAIANVSGYRIERNTGSGFTLVTTVSGTLFSDTGYPCSTTGIQYRVQGIRTSDGSTSNYTNVATGATVACTAPVITAPVSGLQAQGNVNLQWNTVLNSGNNYRVWVATDTAFANSAAGYPLAVNATSNFITTLPDGTYYWKVQAYNNPSYTAAGPFSLVRTFVIDTIAPTTSPTPLTPINNNTVTTERPMFTWAAAAGAAFYQIEINDDSTFTNAAEYTSPGIPGAPATTTFTIPNTAFLPQGDYFWRVRSLDAAGNTGPYSALTPKFTVSLMSTPASNGIVTLVAPAATAPVTFTWMGVTGATGYRIQVDDDSSFGSVDRTCMPVPATALTCALTLTAQKLPAGIYYWRVLVDTQPLTGTHPYRKFTVSPTAPAMPVVLAPAANAVYSDFSTTPRNAASFSWTPVAGLTYTLEIASTAAFTTAPLISVPGLTTSPYVADLTSLGAGTFYWRLKAVNSVGVNSVPSAARALIVDLSAPPVPGLMLPAHQATVNMVRPSLTWGAVTDPAAPVKYRVDISTASDFSSGNLYTDALVTTAAFTPPTNLTTQGDYYWRVQSVDAAGNASVETTPRQFTVNISNTPAANAVMAAGNIAFTWAAVPGATAYQVQIERGGVPDFISPDIICNPTPLTALTCSVGAAAMTTGTYYWRVAATAPAQPVGNAAGTYRALYLGTTAVLPAPTNVHLDAVSGTGAYDTDIYINATEKTGGVNLVWNAPVAVTGLTIQKYIVDFSPVTTFATITETVMTPDGSTTQVAIPASMLLLDGTNKYARVRAVYGTAGSANTASFWFVVDTAAPNVPNPVTTPNMLFSTLKPTLSWGAVTGIAATNGYRIFAEGIDTVNVTVASNLPTTAASYMFPTNLAQGHYNWTVQSVDIAGNFSAPSAPRSFQVNLGTMPNGTISATTRPTFNWMAVPGYVGAYRLKIDDATDFATPVLNHTVTGTSYMLTLPEALTAGSTYYWRIERDTGEAPAPLANALLTLSVGSPTAPTLGSPVNGELVNQVQAAVSVLSWAAANGNGLALINYTVEAANNAAFTNPKTYTTGSTFASYSSLGLTDGVWYWRVKANFPGGSVASASRMFTLDMTLPTAPSNFVVNFGANPTRPTITWTASTGVKPTNGYTTLLSQNPGLAPAFGDFPKVVSAASVAVTAPYTLEQRTYYLFARAEDAAGNVSPQALFNFKVNIASTPANNAIVNAPAATVNQVFTWFAVPGATSYVVQIDADNDGDFVDSVSTCTPTVATATTCTYPGLARGTYAWRVLVNGVQPEAGNFRTLFIMNGAAFPAPGVPQVVETVGSAPYLGDNYISHSEYSSTVNATWTSPAVIGAIIDSYDVQFATNATFTPVAASVNGVVGLSAAIPGGLFITEGARYVRVRANYRLPSGSTLPGAFSAAKMFTVDTIEPVPPTITTPKDGLIVVTRTPALTVGAVATATRYRFTVATDIGFSNVLIDGTSATPTFIVPNAQGLANGTYYWKAATIDIAGNSYGISATGRFVVNAP